MSAGRPPAVATGGACGIGPARAMAMEPRQDRIAVNSAAPGFTGAAMTQAVTPGRFAAYRALEPACKAVRPAEIADALAYFASPRTGFVAGETLFADGGKSPGGPGL